MFSVTTLDLENPARDQEGKVDFSQDFFGKHTNLTVSGQLSGEAFAMAFKNIYTSARLRAENSNTVKHAVEFLDDRAEMAFADLDDNMRLAEAMMKYIISYVLTNCPEEMAFNDFVDRGLLDRLQNVLDHDFGVMTYTEAIEALLKADVEFDYPVYWGCDLQTEHERFLTERLFKETGFCDSLSQGNQSILHEAGSGWENRGSHGLPRARNRRDHWRQSARGRLRAFAPTYAGHGA